VLGDLRSGTAGGGHDPSTSRLIGYLLANREKR